MTQRRALHSALQRLRRVSATIKGLIVDRFGQGETSPKELIDVFWQLKEVEQSLHVVAQHESGDEGSRQAG